MDAAKCSVCGKKEWNHLCSGSKGLSNLPVQEHTETSTIVLRDPLDKRVKVLEKIVDELLKSRRKRSEYMREYMRKKRE